MTTTTTTTTTTVCLLVEDPTSFHVRHCTSNVPKLNKETDWTGGD